MKLRLSPDPLVLAGVIIAFAGYLMPWFRKGEQYRWSFSGWGYASLDTGGGWTLLTFLWLAVALVAALWAGSSSIAATAATVGGLGGLTFALLVVAASFAEFSERGSINWIGELPFGMGVPAMALGFALLVGGGVRATVRTMLSEAGVSPDRS